MPFEWNNVGGAPSADEIEVSVFGPGFGECIVIHVGGGRWVVVDSCIDPPDREDRRPVAERYLRALGVSVEGQVEVIVATHWHDDHIRGMGRLVTVCRNAEFACAHAMTKGQFLEYLEVLGVGAVATEGAKVAEFRQVISALRSDGRAVTYANSRRELKAWPPASQSQRRCVLRSLSPSDREFDLFLLRIAELMPQPLKPKKAAPDIEPNLASVVLQLQWEDLSVLLGADMELHSDARRGWTAIVRDADDSVVVPAGLYKVAHHGSANGHHDEVWTRLIARRPICIVAPFNKQPDARKLPTDADIERISALGSLYLTAPPRGGARIKGREAAVVRSLRESGIETRDLRTPIGLVRARRAFTAGSDWRVEVFEPAYQPEPA